MNNETYKYIFGPVTSRRLGISLGIDLIPYKTCSLDCIYCECGRTSDSTIEIKEHIPFEGLKNELTTYLNSNIKLDAITFAGSGEPTLHSRIGDVIAFLKNNYPEFKVVLLTNSTLFHHTNVRERVIGADTIIASFDAASENVFKKLNRPHKDLTLSQMKDGLLKLREEYQNEMILEVFIVPGVNDSDEELKKIKIFVDSLKPESIQVNSMDRPGTCDWIKPVSKERLKEIENFFGIDSMKFNNLKSTKNISSKDIISEILSTIRRRPCTKSDLKKMTGQNTGVEKALEKLISEDKIVLKKMPRGDFYYTKDRG